MPEAVSKRIYQRVMVPTAKARDPLPHVPASMAGNLPKARPEPVWKITTPDINEFSPWLYPALLQRWPHLTEEMYLRFVANSIHDSNTTLFIRSQDVVGVFQALVVPLDPNRAVEELFIRQRPDTEARVDDDGKQKALIYARALNWAVAIGARSFTVNLDSDAGDRSKSMLVGAMLADPRLEKLRVVTPGRPYRVELGGR